MFSFFKEVNIRKVGDCYGMWIILRIRWGKCWSRDLALPFRHILSVGGTK